MGWQYLSPEGFFPLPGQFPNFIEKSVFSVGLRSYQFSNIFGIMRFSSHLLYSSFFLTSNSFLSALVHREEWRAVHPAILLNEVHPLQVWLGASSLSLP
jgi:hypothetical protein